MNPLLILLGLFGLAAAGSGGGSSNTSSSASGITNTAQDTPPSNDMDDMPMSDDNMDTDMPMDDDGMSDMPMDHGDHDHGGMGDMPSDTAAYVDIMTFGMHHGTSSHTHHGALMGGRTAITTEALEAYNDLRAFLDLAPINDLEEIGEWAFANTLTNNTEPYGEDLKGVGLFYAMQGAKVAWIDDEKFDPQLLADIQREARLGEPDTVMELVEANGIDGFATYLKDNDMVDTFINTLKMEPHYGGWMHGRTHGWLKFADETGKDVAIAHDLNHLTVLSHDQTQPFMNDTFDWPQWPALDAPQADVANYFQSMVTLGDPRGEGIVLSMTESAGALLPEDMAMLMLEPAPDTMPLANNVTEDDATEAMPLPF
ncbi:MAG: hypothetical protein AAF718_00425 [Pseudomonadota bacterium]